MKNKMSRRIVSARAAYFYAIFLSIVLFYVQFPAVPYHILSLLIWYPKELLFLATVVRWRHSIYRCTNRWWPRKLSREGAAHW